VISLHTLLPGLVGAAFVGAAVVGGFVVGAAVVGGFVVGAAVVGAPTVPIKTYTSFMGHTFRDIIMCMKL
jgi:hypothetical protein